MPELPEVETIARKLRPELIGKSIEKAEILWERSLETPSPIKFKKQIKGQVFKTIDRRAKYLNIHLTNYHLFIHLRMSGDLFLRFKTERKEKHDRLILNLSNDKVLVFNDPRKFGRFWLVTDPEEVVSGLGPEPLSDEFTATNLHNALQTRSRQLKPLLLDQSFLAGMGNIYVDEALHMARLHPLAVSNSVSWQQAQDLYYAIRKVLLEGIHRNGASIDWVYRGGEFQNYFRVYARDNNPCQVCSTPIERIIVGQRSTHICPNCQKRETRVENG